MKLFWHALLQDLITAKRSTKVDGSIFVESEAKVALIVRTKGIINNEQSNQR